MDINQVKTDFENGTLICRATMEKVIDMAMVAAACNAKNEKTIVRLHAELEAARVAPVSSHPDDFAVDHFAGAMKAKMADSRVKGRSGWNDPLLCTSAFLRQLLVKAVRKGDPVDVGNFAMMLYARGATTMLPSLNDDIDKQIAVVDAQRHQRLERRLQNVPVELERRAGYDRRARVVEPKG